jgi:hypothetical protein
MKRKASRQPRGTIEIPAEFWKTVTREEFHTYLEGDGSLGDELNRRLADILESLGRRADALLVRGLLQ